MAEFMKSGMEPSKREVLKRAFSDTRDTNSSKQQKRGDRDHPHEMLPVAGVSGVDAEAGSRSCDNPNIEISPKEKSLKAVHKFDLNYTLPDLNETAPLEHIPIIDVGGSNVLNDPSAITEDLEDVVKVVRKLEIEGHILGNFRLKFLTWYSLYSTAKERDVVRTFIRTLNDDRSCLAGQLIDSFSTIINTKP